MAVTKIYVGNLPESCRRSELMALFEKYGGVDECDVVKNYGFVHMGCDAEAKVAIDNLHNSDFMGSTITVEVSHSKVRPKPGMGGKGQCFRCGRQGHWSKECPRGPSRPSSNMNGFRSRDPYSSGPPPPPPSYMYRERMSRYGPSERMRPYPDPYERRALPPPLPPRGSVYDRRSPVGRLPPDYMYSRRPSPPPMPRHRYDPDPYGPPPRGRWL